MTPQEIRAVALQAAVTRATTLSQVPTTSEIKQLADVFAEYITGPESVPLKEVRHPLPQRRVVPIPEQRDEPTEHIDHDGELWGALCAECSHSGGLHKFGGCHQIVDNASTYCPCEGFTDVRPAGTVPCTCEHDRQVHGSHGCGWLGECDCKWVGRA